MLTFLSFLLRLVLLVLDIPDHEIMSNSICVIFSFLTSPGSYRREDHRSTRHRSEVSRMLSFADTKLRDLSDETWRLPGYKKRAGKPLGSKKKI